jgi:ribosomal protein S12 methylthiotransferase accessory factor
MNSAAQGLTFAGLHRLLAGAAVSGRKAYLHGTHRLCPPAETLARVMPGMTSMGITRLANITGLDHVGIPVVMACRPNAQSISVSQGKGLNLEAAKASALMESVESYCAERIELPRTQASYRQIGRQRQVVDVNDLPWCVGSAFHDDLPRLWVDGLDLFAGNPVAVPFELVHTDYTLPGPELEECFAANTNGLASGNHILEAIVHGLCEVIERDATTLWQLRLSDDRRDTVIDAESIDDPQCRELLDRLDAADLDVLIWDATSDIGIATFYCLVIDRSADNAVPEFGAGCHPCRDIALVRALTEAAQARTTYIAGSRDDFDPEWYSERLKTRRRQVCRQLVDTQRPMRSFQDVPHRLEQTVQGDIGWILQRLQAVGLEQAIVVDLAGPAQPFAVVRIIVPGLEGPYKGDDSSFVPGRRALALLATLS